MRVSKSLFLAAMLVVASALFAQQPPNPPMPPGHSMQTPTAHPSAEMPSMDCQAMMDKMKASSKAMDDRLAALVGDMNSAKGSARVDRMAAVINEMVVQRKQMRDDMATMMPQMMNHMMQHMQSGMQNGMAQSMAACPMMKKMPASPQPPSTSPPAHKH